MESILELMSVADFAELSTNAYEFRSSEAYAHLKTKIRRYPKETTWADIRHYIGRLAS